MTACCMLCKYYWVTGYYRTTVLASIHRVLIRCLDAMPLSDLWKHVGTSNRATAVSVSASSRSSDSDSSESSSTGSCVRGEALLKKLKRQHQTANARAAALLARQKKRLLNGVKNQLDPPRDDVKEFQHTYLTSPKVILEHCAKTKQSEAGRQRAVWLYLKAFRQAAKSFFLGEGLPCECETRRDFSHVLSINVNDDTDVKLGSGFSAAKGLTEVRSVMNNLQYHIVVSQKTLSSKDSGPPTAGHEYKWIPFHQPLVVLSRATADQILQEFLGWSLSFCGFVGARLRMLGVEPNIFDRIRRQAFVFVGDANKVNTALFSDVSKAVAHQSIEHGGKTVALQMPSCASFAKISHYEFLATGPHWSA